MTPRQYHNDTICPAYRFPAPKRCDNDEGLVRAICPIGELRPGTDDCLNSVIIIMIIYTKHVPHGKYYRRRYTALCLCATRTGWYGARTDVVFNPWSDRKLVNTAIRLIGGGGHVTTTPIMVRVKHGPPPRS